MTSADVLPEKSVYRDQRSLLAGVAPVTVSLILERDQLGSAAGLIQRLFHELGLCNWHVVIIFTVNEQNGRLDSTNRSRGRLCGRLR